jgi:hypothetical protein
MFPMQERSAADLSEFEEDCDRIPCARHFFLNKEMNPIRK